MAAASSSAQAEAGIVVRPAASRAAPSPNRKNRHRRSPKPPCAVTKLTIRAGSATSKSLTVREHEPIPSADPSRVWFAPKMEKGTIEWTVENPTSATKATIEVFGRLQSRAAWKKELTQEELASGTLDYDGAATPQGTLYPASFLTVANSPYKIKLTLEGTVKEDGGESFTYFDVLIHAIELTWGDYASLPRARADIEGSNLTRILGDQMKGTKGYEETVFDEIKTANTEPKADAKHQVVLLSDLYAKKKSGDMEIEEYVQPTDFELYKKLWGKGPRIPLIAKVTVKKAAGGSPASAELPEALAGCKLIWDWVDRDLKRWREGLTPTKQDRGLSA
jgi:hypothetical protein